MISLEENYKSNLEYNEYNFLRNKHYNTITETDFVCT